jgi:NAD(P)-dependent dehydrogenase (short-subunit alcohol dehydrogenase family)
VRELKNQVVVITGASAGVGRATARAFAREGAKIALLARDPERLEATRREVEAAGCASCAISVDVADAAAVERAAEQIEAELGPIEIWVNNAMTTVFGRFEDLTDEEFKRVTEVTYLGTVYGTRAALKRMRPRDRGVIVQVGSALAYRGIPLQSAYCGAKHAARGFTDSIRTELMHEQSRIHITMVHLPAVNTPQFDWCVNRMPRRAQPVPPIFEPELAAEAVVWAARHRRRELYVGWPALKTIVGNKALPAVGDAMAADDAWEGQMTPEAQIEHRDGNLFHPVPGAYAAHGRFDGQAKRRSIQLWTTFHRTPLLVGASLLAAAGATLWWHRARA